MADETKTVSVIGLGKLGACLAAGLASKDLEVIGVDVHQDVVEAVNRGQAPVQEPGLQDVMTAHRARLHATRSYREAVRRSSITFVLVPTPSDRRGGFSLRYVLPAIRRIGRALATKPDYHVVVVVSTVLPGALRADIIPALETASGKRCGVDLGVCYSPEFVALGSVLRDLLRPDFVLIGESDIRAGDQLAACLRVLCGINTPMARMNLVNAELTKLAVNSYVTMKISFANLLATLCEQLPEGDIDTVTRGLGLDARIGPKYLKGALGYGGPCFPRDNRAMALLAKQLGCDETLPLATHRFNEAQPQRLLETLRRHVAPASTIAVLGLAYKPHTPVIEASQGLALARLLTEEGYAVTVYDPLALEQARTVLGGTATYASSVRAAICQADAVIVTNPLEEVVALSSEEFPDRGKPIVVLDCWRLLQHRLVDPKRFLYLAVGLGNTRRRMAARAARTATRVVARA